MTADARSAQPYEHFFSDITPDRGLPGARPRLNRRRTLPPKLQAARQEPRHALRPQGAAPPVEASA
jgi:hypothetical protein